MRALVTGVAGFIGSHLSERLLSAGHHVRGVDCFTDYYDPQRKTGNLGYSTRHSDFSFVEADLLTCDLDALFDDIDVVFHLAGQPGVRLSWAEGFETYSRLNILATQRMLEAAANHELKRFVFASSSSVYGAADRYPTSESAMPAPASPYGVTKLAAEHLCNLYRQNLGVPTVCLRYFSVYGPRQRPDMGIHRLIDSALRGSEFVMFGDGSQVRDFTYVADVVDATFKAATAPDAPGSILNIGGGSAVSMKDVVAAVTEAVGTAPKIRFAEVALGDVQRTGADITQARSVLKWTAETELSDGIKHHAAAVAETC